jgi:hypothetical protein
MKIKLEKETTWDEKVWFLLKIDGGLPIIYNDEKKAIDDFGKVKNYYQKHGRLSKIETIISYE